MSEAKPAEGDGAPPAGEPKSQAVSFLEAHRLEYGDQVRRFLVVRVAVALVCLAILLIYEEGSPRLFAGAYVTLVIALAVTALHLLLFRGVTNLERVVVFAVFLDVLLTTALVYLTGGIYNVGFAFLYFATILSAVFLISDGAGFLVASLATTALAATAFLYWAAGNYPAFRPLPLVPPQFYDPQAVELRWGRITANLIGVAFAFHGVAFLASRLPYRLSQARILYDEILEQMVEGVVAIDRRGRILLANAEVRRLLNWGHGDSLAGRRYEHILRREEDQQVLQVLARGEDVDTELELNIRGRGPQAVEVRTTVLHDSRDRVRGVVGIFRDLSLRKRLEATEARLARLADTEEMALGIAHEIRNPLGSIRGAVQELTAQAREDDIDRRLSEIVQRESTRLDRIVQQFLDFARMRPPIRVNLDLGQLVEETAMLLARRPEATGVTIECEPPEAYPVSVDPDQLRQAFLNVGVNGLDALGGKGLLRFRFTRTDLPSISRAGILGTRTGIEVAIENDGPPLTPEAARKVFTPFFTTKKGGLGLGMAITQKIVRHHGGDITCTEGALSGPSFNVLLPLAGSEETAA